MKIPFLKLTQAEDGWRASFAFQVFHRQAEEWLEMRWGFNASILLEEALDRNKFFIESQVASEAEYRAGIQPTRTLALRGINLPGIGLQIGILGKVNAQNEDEARRSGLHYAREIYSTFPHDFILTPAELPEDYDRLSGDSLLNSKSSIMQIQRGLAFAPSAKGYHFFPGLWQASSRSNEQIWRSLSAVPNQVLFNILIQPTFFYEGERQALLEIKKQTSKTEQSNEITSAHILWAENFFKRRLAIWKKFFLLQVHVIAAEAPDENLLRSIGSALTRDTSDSPLSGFQIKQPDSNIISQSWYEKILSMDLVPSSRVEDMVDSDEAFAVFRIPYLLKTGLPGANFIGLQAKPPSTQTGQEQ
jgi:hypothetical protein